MHELLETYPTAGKIILDYYKIVMKNSVNISPEMEEFLTDEIITKAITDTLDQNPRALLDLLDDNNIYATVLIDYSNEYPVFKVEIDGSVSESIFENRKDAEHHLLDNAVQLLNNK
jgi:hypothetical protein